MKNDDPHIMRFMANHYIPRPEIAFTINAAAHPPRTECYTHWWNNVDYPNEKMVSVDIK